MDKSEKKHSNFVRWLGVLATLVVVGAIMSVALWAFFPEWPKMGRAAISGIWGGAAMYLVHNRLFTGEWLPDPEPKKQ